MFGLVDYDKFFLCLTLEDENKGKRIINDDLQIVALKREILGKKIICMDKKVKKK